MTNISSICKMAKLAANKFTLFSSKEKNDILLSIKREIFNYEKEIIEANKLDILLAKESNKNSAFIDRLTLTPKRIATMCDGIDAIVALPDAVGRVEEKYTLNNGLNVERVRAPLGVIGIIYEARPNVTIDAAALCIKSSNGVILRGSKDAINSNRKLVEIMKKAIKISGCNENIVGFIDGTDRNLSEEMLKLDEFIDVVIPRGGEGLKKFVLENAKMPVIASSGGNCHIFIEKTADFEMAQKIIENAKISRPSVCNAAETLLCERSIAKEFLPYCLNQLYEKGVEIRGTKEVQELFPKTKVVDDDEFFVEYNVLIIKIKIVENINEAISHINFYSTNHSEAIITRNEDMANKFSREVDSAAIYINASTRFTDGFELGLGAEMGISTQKLHVRGPIGIKELTSLKYVIKGNGQIR